MPDEIYCKLIHNIQCLFGSQKLSVDAEMSPRDILYKLVTRDKFYRLYNSSQGYTGDRDQFLSLISIHYQDIDPSCISRFFRNPQKHFEDFIKILELITNRAIESANAYSLLREQFIELENKYINMLLEIEPLLISHDICDGLASIIKLHEIIESSIRFEVAIFIPFKENIKEIQESIKNTILYKSRIDELIRTDVDAKEALHDYGDGLVTIFEHYRSLFHSLKEVSPLNDRKYYPSLENLFTIPEVRLKHQSNAITSPEVRSEHQSNAITYSCTLSYKGIRKEYTIRFYNHQFIIYDENPLETVPYDNIYKAKVYDDSGILLLKIIWDTSDGRNGIIVPFEKMNSLKEIYNLLKKDKENSAKHNSFNTNEAILSSNVYLKPGIMGTDPSKIKNNGIKSVNFISSNKKTTPLEEYHIALITLGQVSIFIKARLSDGFENFKKKTFYKMAKYFFPKYKIEEKCIDLNRYQHFRFYIVVGRSHVYIAKEEDFQAAIIFLDSKLRVVIKYQPNMPNIKMTN
ncbi:hypothetical protein TCON_0561 [Astathelohania contejeani]|uniref:DH domain-containing protein n=1 Tax=Astathelohania contejeani TaxID=164912 RepID=A0ABQ7I1E7_9MICR|nr:hypothetical protein TCON_0561 [Thelohania contejeani]